MAEERGLESEAIAVDQLNLKEGMVTEIMTPKNKLVFIGKIESYANGVLTVRESAERELPLAVYNREVKARFIQGERIVMVKGKVCGSTKTLWRIDRLEAELMQEKRAFFRQSVTLDTPGTCVLRSAGALNSRGGHGEGPCKIVDVSVGGIRISSPERYEVGDRLSIINVHIVPSEEPFSFTCRVRRAVPDGRESLYGCQFEALLPKEQDRLLRAIFTVQRLERQKKKEL
ncbi:MAG: PilZ domain-containing protein [Lawsonibacter sp.]|nr:PilZ domain-containing protein [Lawsonibacter sp.]